MSEACAPRVAGTAGGESRRGSGHTDPGPAPRPWRATRRRREIAVAYLLLAPALALVFGVLAYPITWEVWASLTNHSVAHLSGDFVGLANYFEFLGNRGFWQAAHRTFWYAIVTGVLKLAVGVGMALALSRSYPGRSMVFLAGFLPWAYPAGVTVIGWYLFTTPPIHTAYSPFMNDLRALFDTRWGDGTWGFITLMVFNIWRGGAFTGIFLLAALNGIPRDLFDYAALEVRSAWRRFWMVTVPLLRPFLALAAFLSLVTAMADLGNVWLLTGGRDTYPTVWTEAFTLAVFSGQWGKGSALSLILLPAMIVFLLAGFRILEPRDEGAP
jgi:ABC-type sugar transport system permease subunit